MIRICGNSLEIDGSEYEVKKELVTLLTYVYNRNKEVLGRNTANAYLMELILNTIQNKDNIEVNDSNKEGGYME